MKPKKQKIREKIIFVGVMKVTDEKSRIQSWIRMSTVRYGSADQDLYQNVTVPEHRFLDNRIRFCTKISDRVLDSKLYRYRTRSGIFFTTEGTLTYHNRRIILHPNNHYRYR